MEERIKRIEDEIKIKIGEYNKKVDELQNLKNYILKLQGKLEMLKELKGDRK